MSKKAENLAEAFIVAPFVLLLAAAVLVPMSIYNGWAISVIWSMVAVPVFGADPLPISACIGLYVLVNILKQTHPRMYKGHESETWKEMLTLLLAPLLSILIAWSAMQFYTP